MNLINQSPLTENEIEELDCFLLDSPGLEESMDISTLDGFLTAIVCGPKTIMPSEWTRWVWDMEKGEDSPEFKTQTQAQKILGLLIRHMNDINHTLSQAPELYEPLLMENPNDGDPIPIIDEWCTGFMKGVLLDSEGWLPVLVGKSDWLSGTVCQIHAFWMERLERNFAAGELPDVIQHQPIGNTNKVRRNDPCPCGSGKKYKFCHGTESKLH